MQTVIKQRPILFSTEMVKAILEGRKIMTRRKLKVQPEPPRGIYSDSDAIPVIQENGEDLLLRFNWKTERSGKVYQDASFFESKFNCPYGKVGDVLWVRETFVRGCVWDGEGSEPSYYDMIGEERPEHLKERYWYRADGDCPTEWHNEKKDEPGNIPWKPSIFMPREACRLFLSITDIRVERLQDITEEDAEREGIELVEHNCYKNYDERDPYQFIEDPIGSFRSLWESINGLGSWEKNEWVWVVSFERIDKPE